VDWTCFDRESAEKRDELLSALRAAAAERGETFEVPTARCDKTPDLFTDQ